MSRKRDGLSNAAHCFQGREKLSQNEAHTAPREELGWTTDEMPKMQLGPDRRP